MRQVYIDEDGMVQFLQPEVPVRVEVPVEVHLIVGPLRSYARRHL